MAKPEYPAWLPSNPVGNPAIIQLPSVGQRAAGYAVASKAPAQWFNWFWNIASGWFNLLGPAAYDVVVGAGAYCTHADLATAVADATVVANPRVLLVDSVAAVNATIVLSKAGWLIDAGPGVTYTAGSATVCLSVQAPRVEIRRLKFSGFTTAIQATVAGGGATWDYGRVLFCNFLTCTTEVDDASAVAGKKPVTLGNITE